MELHDAANFLVRFLVGFERRPSLPVLLLNERSHFVPRRDVPFVQRPARNLGQSERQWEQPVLRFGLVMNPGERAKLVQVAENTSIRGLRNLVFAHLGELGLNEPPSDLLRLQHVTQHAGEPVEQCNGRSERH